MLIELVTPDPRDTCRPACRSAWPLAPAPAPALALALVLALGVLTALAPAPGLAQAPASVGAPDDLPPLPSAQAVWTTETIHLDGHLDEPAWQTAAASTSFTQVDPAEGQPSSQPAEVRLLYDEHAIYVGVRLHQPDGVSTRLGRRDMNLLDADWFGVGFDSYHDRRTAFVFDVNPSGVQRDEIKTMSPEGHEQDDNSWDAVWDVATSIDDGGWTAEYRIPFSQLRFSPAEEQTWGVQFERIIGRNHEYATWAFTPKRAPGGVPRWGTLHGLRGIEPGKRLEVLPYVVGRATYVDPGANPFRTDAEYSTSAGVDLRYRVTSDLTLNATVNPDFGQVEVDPAVVNLGVYETFFEEKRPFFVEGSEIFDFDTGGGGLLFYSRRIGRAPQLFAPTEASDQPVSTTILGAAKLSGKTQSGWSIGVMEGLTAREDARYLTQAGEAADFTVEPLTNYLAVRLRRETNRGESALGGMFTAVNRDLATSPLQASLRSAAYAGGLDLRKEWSDRTWVLQGSATATYVTGTSSSILAVQRASNHYFQRPDAEHLEVDSAATSLAGLSAQLSLGKQAGEHWRGSLTAGTITPGYEVNDLGFGYRTDRRDAELDATYVENRPGRFWRNYNISTRFRYEHNTANQLIANWNTATAYFRHLSFWAVHLFANYSLRANDDRLTRGGPMAVRPAGWQLQGDFFSDARKPVTYELGIGGSRDEFGGWTNSFDVELGLKLSPRWNLTIGPELERGYVVAQYVATFDDPAAAATFGRAYVFAPLTQTTLSMETRFNLTFTPKLSLETFVQPFLSSADYGDAKRLLAPRTFDFAPYAGEVPNRDFNLRSLRGNAVLRWEWRPGSTLYLAWQQTREDFAAGIGDFDFHRDRLALFRTRPDNIVVLKVSYWFAP